MAAAGRVCTGYSKPKVALYGETGGVVSYTSGQDLARGVSVTLDIQAADENKFYANNVVAEDASGTFGGGTVTLVNDGLKRAAARLIYGLPSPDGDGWVPCDDDTSIPYVGIGYIKQYMEEGVTSWVPVVLKKCKFQMFGDSAATQEDEIDWQTQELTATVMRDDSAKHCWRLLGNEYASEALAEAALNAVLGIS